MDFPDPGMEPGSSALQMDSLPAELPGKSKFHPMLPYLCLLRKLYVGQEPTVRTLYETDWYRIEKGVPLGCLLSPCLFNLYTEHIMRDARLGEFTSWNQDRRQKYQQTQICAEYNNGRKQRGTKESFTLM